MTLLLSTLDSMKVWVLQVTRFSIPIPPFKTNFPVQIPSNSLKTGQWRVVFPMILSSDANLRPKKCVKEDITISQSIPSIVRFCLFRFPRLTKLQIIRTMILLVTLSLTLLKLIFRSDFASALMAMGSPTSPAITTAPSLSMVTVRSLPSKPLPTPLDGSMQINKNAPTLMLFCLSDMSFMGMSSPSTRQMTLSSSMSSGKQSFAALVSFKDSFQCCLLPFDLEIVLC